MAKARQYEIVLGEKKTKYRKAYRCTQRNMTVAINLSKMAACIEFRISSEMSGDHFFPEGSMSSLVVEKALLAHLLVYGVELCGSEICVIRDGELVLRADSLAELGLKDKALPASVNREGWACPDEAVHAMINRARHCPVFDDLGIENDVAEKLRAAAVAFVRSRATKDLAMKFLYLWVSFNGMYGFFSSLVRAHRNKAGASERNTAEWKQLRRMHSLLGASCGQQEWNKRKRDAACKAVASRVCEVGSNVTRASLSSGEDAGVARAIEEVLQAENAPRNFDAWRFLMIEMGYWLRCNYFHSSWQMKLYGERHGVEERRLFVVNSLLDEYIRSNLFRWLGDAEVVEGLVEDARRIAKQEP
ncbi:MAG: hypothetical protein Q4D06_06470 [Coriobacteriia bacterium]|nr:hypothetical protein [Coriobacteriia bacterium]